MAIYHLSCSILTKKKGQSAVAAAAYQAGEKILSDRDGLTKDYSKKKNVYATGLFFPPELEHLQKDFSREKFWNQVENAETKKNAQLARSINLALPNELSIQENSKLVEKFFDEVLSPLGMISDVAIHNPPGNPHAHFLIPMRKMDHDGNFLPKSQLKYLHDEKGKRIPVIDPDTQKQKIGKNGRRIWKMYKERSVDWDSKETLSKIRHGWARCCNQALRQAGFDARISCRSNLARGLSKPGVHVGPAGMAMAKRGIITDRFAENATIAAENAKNSALAVFGIIAKAFSRAGGGAGSGGGLKKDLAAILRGKTPAQVEEIFTEMEREAKADRANSALAAGLAAVRELNLLQQQRQRREEKEEKRRKKERSRSR